MNAQTETRNTTKKETTKKAFKKEEYKTFDTGAQKELTGKLRTDLIPPEAEEALARVYSYGAQKYEDRNWEKGIPYTKLIGALKRHLLQFQKGEDYDVESGLLHTDHMAFYTAALSTFMARRRRDLNDRSNTYDLASRYYEIDYTPFNAFEEYTDGFSDSEEDYSEEQYRKDLAKIRKIEEDEEHQQQLDNAAFDGEGG